MKKTTITRTVALLCTGILAVGTVTAVAAVPTSLTGWTGLSRNAFTWLLGAEKADIQLPMLENALREYFGLDEDESLTTDHLAQVTSIRFERSPFDGNLPEEYDGKTAVKCVINEGVLPGVPYHENNFGYEVVPTTVRVQNFVTDSITDEKDSIKFRAFYTKKDANDPQLTELGVAEMQALFPNTLSAALYILDPMATPRELRELAQIALNYGFANTETLIDGTEIDLTEEDAAQFPNLTEVVFDDLTPARDLGDVTVRTEATLTMTTEEVHLMETAPMLYGALREYFGLSEGDALTPEMLAQVKTIRFGLSKFHGMLTGTYEGMTAVKCVINDGFLPGTEEREGLYGDLAYELYPFVVRAKYFQPDDITDEWDLMKFRSFYTVKDIHDPTLAPEDAAEMLQGLPNLQADALVICDPHIKERELKELANLILEYNIGNTVTLIDGMTIDLRRLNTALFPNLESIDFTDGLVGEMGLQ